jgi:hypothetical protein
MRQLGGRVLACGASSACTANAPAEPCHCSRWRDPGLHFTQALYEAVRADRNLYSKTLIEAQDEINELKRKAKITTHQARGGGWARYSAAAPPRAACPAPPGPAPE